MLMETDILQRKVKVFSDYYDMKYSIHWASSDGSVVNNPSATGDAGSVLAG